MKALRFLLFIPILFAFTSIVGDKKYKKLPDGIYAEMNTNKGSILLTLEYEKVPKTVANFVGLAEGTIRNFARGKGEPYYDGIIFHRVIKNFMMQGGDPKTIGAKTIGYSFKDEFHDSLKHVGPGILSMANRGPNTNACQFFITHKSTPWLDNKHSVFGHVVQGMEVMNSVVTGDTLHSVKIIRKGKTAKKFNPAKVFPESDRKYSSPPAN